MYNIYILYTYIYIYSWQKIWCNGINATVRLWTGEQDLVRGHDEDLHGILIDSRLSCAPAVAEAVVKASTTACEESLREEISSTHLQTVQVRWRHLNKAFVCCTWKYIASSWGSSAKWCPPRSHRWPSYLLRRLSSGVPLSEPSRMIATSKGCGWLPGQLPHPDILTSSIQHNVWGKLWKGQRRHNHCSCCAPCLVWCCDDATTCVPVGQGIETVSERFNIMFQLSLAFLLANLEGNQEKLLAHPWWWGLATLQQVTAGQDLAFRKHLHTTAAFSCRKCFMGRVCRVASKHPPKVQN